MQMSGEDVFSLREKDIIMVTEMIKEIVLMYEAYILSEDMTSKKMTKNHTDIKQTAGYLGKINEARALFDRIYKENKS